MKLKETSIYWHELAGLTFVRIQDNEDSITLYDTTGARYVLQHFQSCCENVRIVKTEGNPLSEAVNLKCTNALNEHPGEPDWHKSDYDASYTWETFELRFGDVSLKWWVLGESNGYYGETMDLIKYTPDETTT